MPNRLIDVGDTSSMHITLRGQSTIPLNSKYMTLSHCWGSHVTIKLQTSTLASMSHGLHLADLPKTLQEAVQVTRHVGVRYLWIDALCIIQDSDEDWQTESALMHIIYSNSLCNIAATGSSDGNGRLFYERNTLVLNPPKIRTAGKIFIPQYRWLWSDSVEDAPLNRRAWVFQERFLSPRNLHSTRNQLFWECEAKSACESCPEAFPDYVQIGDPSRKRRFRTTLCKAVSDSPDDANLDLYNIWSLIVQQYSRGRLTCCTDKLVAIRGVAAKLQAAMNEKYLAGLWPRYLANELLWVARSGEK
jgi:hypothetical protein